MMAFVFQNSIYSSLEGGGVQVGGRETKVGVVIL